MTNRAPLRAEFDSIANQKKSDANFATRSQQIEVLESTIIQGFNHIVKFLDGKTTKTEIINQLQGFATTKDVETLVNSIQKLDKTTLSTKIELKPVLEALKGLQAEMTAIPDRIKFEKTEKVSVDNLEEIKLDTTDLEKAIKALKLDVKVDAPKINVEKPDLKPLQDVMLDLLKAFNKQKFEIPKKFTIDNLKDIKTTDTSNIEKKIDTGNKYLKEISEKKFGGSGGGGESTLSFPLYADMTVSIVTAGVVKTITETDGIKTCTTTIDSTDPNNKTINSVWS